MQARWRGCAAVCVMACGAILVARAAAYDQKPDPAAILAAAREALGGAKKLDAVKTFNATGRTKKIQGNNLLPVEFEIWCELPDKYARKDEVPAQESGPTTAGFNGDDLIQVPALSMPTAPPGAGRPGAPPMNPATQFEAMKKGRVMSVKQDFARLTLGMFASSFSSFPLTWTYVGQAEAPQGLADVVEGKGPGNFTVRLFVSDKTHLPIMISWTAGMPAGMPPGMQMMAPPGARGAAGPPPASAAPPKPNEFRIYYSDYRDNDGLMWPFKLRRATNADTTEETTFDKFRINSKIDPRKFEVMK